MDAVILSLVLLTLSEASAFVARWEPPDGESAGESFECRELIRQSGMPIVRARLNGVDSYFFVDTGSIGAAVPLESASDWSFAHPGRWTITTTLRGPVRVRQYSDVPLKLGSLPDAFVTVAALEFGHLGEILPTAAHGLLGADFLRDHAFRLALCDSEVEVLASPAEAMHGHMLRNVKVLNDGRVDVDVTLPVLGPMPFMVDTGIIAGGTNPDLVMKKDMLERLVRYGAAVRLEDDVPAAENTSYVIRWIEIGELRFTNVVVHAGKTSLIGSELLRDLDVMIDFPESKVWLAPPERDQKLIEGTFDASGMTLRFRTSDSMVVEPDSFLPEGAAGQAGVQEGDIVKAINDRSVSEWSFLEVDRLLSAAGTTVKLQVVRQEQELTINVPLKHDQTLFNFPPEWPPEQPEFNPCGPVDARQN